MMEDAQSAVLRPYLSCPVSDLHKIYENFRMFDADGSGAIDGSELQQLMFEMGMTVPDNEVGCPRKS